MNRSVRVLAIVFVTLVAGSVLVGPRLRAGTRRGGVRGDESVAISWSANRLVALQNDDGGWARDAAGAGGGGAPAAAGSSEPASYGTGGRSLLWAWNVTGSSLHLRAARRAGDHLIRALPRDPSLRCAINGVFLAELGRATSHDSYGRAARIVFVVRRQHYRWTSGAEAARQYREEAVPEGVDPDLWKNLQLWRGLEDVELARAVGEEAFAREMAGALLRGHAFEPGTPLWGIAAARAVEVLSGFPDRGADLRAEGILDLLLSNQAAPGVVWSDAPDDGFVYALDNAAFLRGLSVARDPRVRGLAANGAAFFVERQLRHGTGGWEDVLPLETGAALAREDRASVREYPGVSAEILTALARSRRPILGRT